MVTSWFRRLRKNLFSISPDEASFARRGFYEGCPKASQRLEQAGYTFLQGYHAALEGVDPDPLAFRLNKTDRDLRGFAFEGAAMALTLLDQLMPGSKVRFSTFLGHAGSAHVYMMHVGAGWAFARLRRRVKRPFAKHDPLLGWLAIDGYGFHEGYFHWPHYVEKQALPKRVSGYARRVFDQGLGRSLWFICGADVSRILAIVSAFPSTRQADLWSGVGLACAYAGGVGETEVVRLQKEATPYGSHLAQGAAFAAKARQRAGNPAAHTHIACQLLCGLSAADAAVVADHALIDLPTGNHLQPSYEIWRRRIQQHFVKEVLFT